MVPWIHAGAAFPPADTAMRRPNGLLAASSPAELTSDRLVQAYRAGIFPWYSEGQPILWWSPDPRMVLRVDGFHASRSLRKCLRAVARASTLHIHCDRAFEAVMRACAAPRPGQDGTWITEAMVRAYCELAQRGLAHSIELSQDGQLVGGIYGVALGRMFFGESMFSRIPNASKIALAALVELLRREGAAMLDCQQNSNHLASLGAREIARTQFDEHLTQAVQQAPMRWSAYRDRRLNALMTDH